MHRTIKLLLKMALWSFISLSFILFSIKILAYIKATPGEKCGMKTTLAMPSLTFLTTSLLAA